MVRAATDDRPPVHFRGAPAGLTGVIAEGAASGDDMVLALRYAKGDREPDEFAVQVDEDPRILHLFLPAELAPGSYDAVLTVGTSSRAAQVDVQAAPQLRVFPEQLRLVARSGESVASTLTILNAGNVPVTVRAVQAFGIIMAGGIERALRRAYVTNLADAQRRVDVIADSLAAAHGGLVKMRIAKGDGVLQPGELRSLDVEIRIPRDLETGSEYGGNWELPGLVYPVTVAVPGEPVDAPDDDSGGPVVN
jgi:hypothetical protein